MADATQTAEPARITPELLVHLRTWEGRSESFDEPAGAAPVRALAATLDRDADTPASAGAALPPLWHWLYFLPRAPQREIGADGHPRLGGFLPPVPLPRRMWAGGRLQWHAPLRVGDALERSTRIESVTHKSGRSGDLVFLLLRHEVRAGGVLALTEEQDIVYRAPAQASDPVPAPQAAPTDATWSREIVPDPVLLFRFSALTFNAHRIHYDRPYATGAEGYPGLVVHGPLIALEMLNALQAAQPGLVLRSFDFTPKRPITVPMTMHAHGKRDGDGWSLWMETDGALASVGRVTA